MKGYLIYCLCSVFLMMQMGCLTSTLYSVDKFSMGNIFAKKTKNVSITDTINAFLMDDKKEKLIIVGEKYHYIFELTGKSSLVNILRWKNRHYLTASFENFQIQSETEVSGFYHFKIKNEYQDILNQEDISFLKQQNFVTSNKNENTAKLTHKDKINGTRYTAKKLNLQSTDLLSQNYTINFIELIDDTSIIKKASRILLTPLAVTADGIIIIATASLIGIVSLGMSLDNIVNFIVNFIVVKPINTLGNFLFSNDTKIKEIKGITE